MIPPSDAAVALPLPVNTTFTTGLLDALLTIFNVSRYDVAAVGRNQTRSGGVVCRESMAMGNVTESRLKIVDPNVIEEMTS
jgi:hypothetical protein